MATIANTLLAGSWLSSIAAGVFVILAITFQVMRNNQTWAAAAKGTAEKAPGRMASAFAAIYNKPRMFIDILALAGLFFFIKAIAYWALFYGVGITGANFWGESLGWTISFLFFTKAISDYLCLKADWKFITMYAVAAAPGALFAGSFTGPANQLAFVILAGVWFLLFTIVIWVFRDRMSTCKHPDTWATVALILFIVAFYVGYYTPFILSPVYMGTISNTATIIWYLVADFVVLVWFVILAVTAIDCSIVEKILKDEVASRSVSPAQRKFQ